MAGRGEGEGEDLGRRRGLFLLVEAEEETLEEETLGERFIAEADEERFIEIGERRGGLLITEVLAAGDGVERGGGDGV